MTRRFGFRLARDLGVWNVDAMLDAMTSRQLTEWAAAYRLDAEDERNAALQADAQAHLQSMDRRF